MEKKCKNCGHSCHCTEGNCYECVNDVCTNCECEVIDIPDSFINRNQNVISVTDKAREYLAQVGQPNVYLSVKGGGCSGFTYVWEMSAEKATVDNLVVDPMAEMFVLGCTIDYVTELGGSYLKVINPNATASCGCGESFAI